MAKTNNLHDFLVDLANAIRTKKKYPDSQKINPQNFSEEIDGISGGDNKLAQLLNKTITEVTEEDFGEATKVDNSAFNDCVLLEEVAIPNSVTSIGDASFNNCKKLVNVSISENLVSVGSNAFAGCLRLEEIHLPDTVTSIGQYAFQNCKGLISFKIPNGVKIIEVYLFDNCEKLVSVEFPDTVTEIKMYAFNHCCALSNVILPSSLKTLGSYSFDRCSGLTEIAFPSTLKNIPYRSFGSCKSLAKVFLPSSITSIDNFAFSGSDSISEIHIEDLNSFCRIKDLGNLMQYGAVDKKIYLNGIALTSLEIPDGVTSIPDFGYRGTSVSRITMPDSITSNVGRGAFYDCRDTYEIELGNNITKIPEMFMYNCYELLQITIPENVTSCGMDAFRCSKKLKDAYFKGKPSAISSYFFRDCNALLDIYVPWAQGAVSGAPWGATNATIHYNWTPPTPGGDYTGTYEGDGSYSMRYFKIYDANDSLISSGDVDWSGTVTVPQGGRLVVSAQETYGGIYVKVNNLVNCTASEVDSWAETITITPTADNFSFHCEDDFD